MLAVSTAIPQVASGGPSITVGLGYVRDAAGNPIAGATVAVTLWANTEVPVGHPVDTLVLARGSTDSAGFFRLEVTDPGLIAQTLAAARINGGFANLELTIQGGTLVYTTFYSLGMAPGGIAPLQGIASPFDQASSFDQWVEASTGRPLQVRSVTLAPRASGVARVPQRARGPVASLAPAIAPAAAPCLVWFKTRDLTERFGVVGEMHRWKTVIPRGEFTYGATADSTFGVGFSADGGVTWSVNGSAYVGNTAGSAGSTNVTSLQSSTGYMAEAKFKRAEFAQACTRNLKRQATQWNGYDVRRGAAVSGFDGKCDTTYAAYRHDFPRSQKTWTRASGTAVWWTSALSLGTITVGGRSGFSTNASTTFVFTNSDSNFKTVCGNDAEPLATSTRVFAGVSTAP